MLTETRERTSRRPTSRQLGLLGVVLVATVGVILLVYGILRPVAVCAPSSVYVRGLVNPRGLVFDGRGTLYVAEAGSGGNRVITVDSGERFNVGLTGRVSRVPAPGQRASLLERLPSSFSNHQDELGSANLAIIGDDLYLLTAQGGHSFGDPTFDNAIVRIRPDGTHTRVLNYNEFSLAQPSLARRSDPRADVAGGMPFGMVALNGRLYTTDANLEFVQEVTSDGQPLRRLLEYPASNRVLTNLAVGPDGAFYVAELGPYPYVAGSGRITRLTLDGQASPAALGLTTPIAPAFGPDGSLYVAELSQPPREARDLGRVVRVLPDGREDVVLAPLSFPTAMVIGPDGDLYVTNNGHLSRHADGEVVEIEVAGATPATRALDSVRSLGPAGLARVAARLLALALAGGGYLRVVRQRV
ncbi:MAG: ScyD/ScyE family protein [Chloroflexi bacterium]|nr:ScyD/ScyE family protein [Chloroflexota bacterium]